VTWQGLSTEQPVAPTAVRTDFSRVLWETPDALARATARVPIGRIGEPDDVAGLAFLLASPVGSFINGQVIGADWSANAWYQLVRRRFRQLSHLRRKSLLDIVFANAGITPMTPLGNITEEDYDSLFNRNRMVPEL
jgi:NAD(P)-dependent dehydrogenase (short-subunit alcohol dehydrogenase family)